MKKESDATWHSTNTNDFWKHKTHHEHVLHIYDSHAELINILSGFVGTGINNVESIVLIATPVHLEALDTVLTRHGIHKASLVNDNRYIALDAAETLSRFMVDGQPRKELFTKTIDGVLKRARGTSNREVRAFGEMVALLWAQGQHEATLRLEELWVDYCRQNSLTLLCAYPKDGFTGSLKNSVEKICGTHSRIVTGSERPLSELLYRVIDTPEFRSTST